MARTRSSTRAASARSSGAREAPKEPAAAEPEIKEGSLYFHVRQKSGAVLALLAIVFMVAYYKYNPDMAVFGGFAVLLVGWGIHEARPFKRLELVRAIVENEKNK